MDREKLASLVRQAADALARAGDDLGRESPDYEGYVEKQLSIAQDRVLRALVRISEWESAHPIGPPAA